MNNDFLPIDTLLSKVKSNATLIDMLDAYHLGKEWSENSYQHFEQDLSSKIQFSKREMYQAVFRSWWSLTGLERWGKLTADMFEWDRQGFFINLEKTSLDHDLKILNLPVGPLYAGILAGALSVLLREGLSCIGFDCPDSGNDRFRFYLDNHGSIDADLFWNQMNSPMFSS